MRGLVVALPTQGCICTQRLRPAHGRVAFCNLAVVCMGHGTSHRLCSRLGAALASSNPKKGKGADRRPTPASMPRSNHRLMSSARHRRP